MDRYKKPNQYLVALMLFLIMNYWAVIEEERKTTFFSVGTVGPIQLHKTQALLDRPCYLSRAALLSNAWMAAGESVQVDACERLLENWKKTCYVFWKIKDSKLSWQVRCADRHYLRHPVFQSNDSKERKGAAGQKKFMGK